jgi:PAS domain S-box-containing protein
MLKECVGLSFSLMHADQIDEALKMLKEKKFDVVLLDLNLPDSQGLGGVEIITAQEPGVPVIILTGLDDETLGIQAMRKHAGDYLVKGQINSNILVRSIRYAIERKRAEETLKASEEKYRTLVESSTDAIFMLDKERKIVSSNQAFNNLFGFDKNEVEGKSIRIIHPSDESFNAFGDLAYPIINKTGFFRIEWALMHKDGRVFPVETVNSTIKSSDGSITGYVGIARDITERKKMEQELKIANRDLEAFSYSVSHDLKAPLLNIAALTKLLQKAISGALDKKAQQYLTLLQESAKQMEDLIDDFLAFSRISHVEIHKAPINMEELIKGVLPVFQTETKGRDIVWKINPLPEVYGDSSMLRLVFTNLISNALKFTRPRQRTLIEIGCGLSGDHDTVFFVRDNGVGFDMKYVDKLFGVFQRLHSYKEFKGTGIGLANVQRIIQRHGGRVWAEGAVNEGATFYFSLPKK